MAVVVYDIENFELTPAQTNAHIMSSCSGPAKLKNNQCFPQQN